MKKVLLVALLILLGLGWWWQFSPHPVALPLGTTIPIIHKSENTAIERKRVQIVHHAGRLRPHPQLLL